MPIYIERRENLVFIDSHYTLLNDQSIYQGEPFTRRRPDEQEAAKKKALKVRGQIQGRR
jgi:hypothetical protein